MKALFRRSLIAPMRTGVLLLACAVSGCGAAESTKLMREAQMVTDNGGSYAEQCEAWTKVRDAYLREENVEQYRFAKTVAAGNCALAS